MGALTETQVQQQLSDFAKWADESRLFGNATATNNVVALQAAIAAAAVGGEYSGELTAAIAAARARYAAYQASDVDVLTWVLREYMVTLGKQDNQVGAMVDRIYDRWVVSGDRVASRGLTLVAPVAGGGNIGNGILQRLTLDEQGFVPEGTAAAETKTAEVTADATSTAERHQEVLTVRGPRRLRDVLERDKGSGTNLSLTALTPAGSSTPLANGDFFDVTTASGTAPTAGAPQVLSALGNWNVFAGSVASLTSQADLVHRSLVEGREERALRWTGNVGIRKNLIAEGLDLGVVRPYQVYVAAAKETGLSAGTLNVRLGTTTLALDLTTLAAFNVYEVRGLPLTSGLFYRNFNPAGDLLLELEVTGLVGGNVSVSEVILAEGSFVDGTWFWAVGGSTPWKLGDLFTMADTDAGTGKIQRAVARATGRYLPHSGAPTLPDPV